ncbi:aminotransferase class I/II-fold pyridoxal phosphate-dependent enzyme [Winogradskyella tangerina]|uniref:aminotransferase class I/II-fold pyridoxal phosphate-dependent enzyme n=1 Tax=Winogradskyella tangerina TaxID=2023240 RepID=UPI000DBE1B64|nr:8-amino-7-oxononanoate synthase [Winogradskyella tangerina]
MLPKKLQKKLEERKANNAFRQLGSTHARVDFSSNDYLGFSNSEGIFNAAHQYLIDHNLLENGATGSRLLSGNHTLYSEIETELCNYHQSEAALICNSGYDANIGLLSSVPQRGDIILYDELVHASIRDGIQMSNAKAYKFKHNDLEDLEIKCQAQWSDKHKDSEIYIVTESVFSMDGDTPDLIRLAKFSKKNDARLIIDEAHAVGVFNFGLVQEMGIEKDVFARIITFGKALGSHGAAILGATDLKNYLVNFSRPFIYTTALPPHTLATVKMAYKTLKASDEPQKLHANIEFFKRQIELQNLSKLFIESQSAIHCCIISGNEIVKEVALQLQNNGFDVKPILSPTVPAGTERLRFCLHSYNSEAEISEVLRLLATFVKSS